MTFDLIGARHEAEAVVGHGGGGGDGDSGGDGDDDGGGDGDGGDSVGPHRRRP